MNAINIMTNYINLYKYEFVVNNFLLSIDFTKKIFKNILNFYESNKTIKNINLHKFSKKKHLYSNNTYCSQYDFSFKYDNLLCNYYVYNYTYSLNQNVNQKTTIVLFSVNFPHDKNYKVTENNDIIEILLGLHEHIKKCIMNSNIFEIKDESTIKYITKCNTKDFDDNKNEIYPLNISFCNSINDFNIYDDEENQNFHVKMKYNNKVKPIMECNSLCKQNEFETNKNYFKYIENIITKITKDINSLSIWISKYFKKNNFHKNFYTRFFYKKM